MKLCKDEPCDFSKSSWKFISLQSHLSLIGITALSYQNVIS